MVKLNLSYNKIENLEPIKDLEELVELDLSHNNYFRFLNIEILNALINIKKLDLSSNGINDNDIKNIIEINYNNKIMLEELILSYCTLLTNRSIELLSKCANLKILVLISCSNITEKIYNYIKKDFKALKYLYLNDNNLHHQEIQIRDVNISWDENTQIKDFLKINDIIKLSKKGIMYDDI